MALDVELQIVDSEVVDVSEGTNLLTLGRRGFTRDTNFVVVIEAVTAATPAANVIPVQFVLQISLDSGSTYVDQCVITLTLAASLARVGIWSVPIGLLDLRDEKQAVDDLTVRVKVTYTNNAETDDFTYSAYIAGPGPYRSNDLT